LFDPRREGILPSRSPIPVAAATQGQSRLAAGLRPPAGLGLDGPEHGGMLAWRRAEGSFTTCNFKLVVLGHFLSPPLLTFGVTVSFDPRWEPLSVIRPLAASTYIRSGQSPYQGPSCNVRGHRAPRRMGSIYYAAYCSPAKNRSHIHLGNGIFLSSSCGASIYS
jgi:hypothetical protein